MNFLAPAIRAIILFNAKLLYELFSTKNKGWGIGLNLTKRIIEYIHKGKIKLNKSDQYQTVFEINLDLSIS